MAGMIPRYVLAGFMVLMGVLHFVAPKGFARTIPSFLPAPMALVYISGVFEALGGAGLLVPAVQHWAAWGLVALYVAVFPANVNMAVKNIGFTKTTPRWMLWARLPFQPALIVWAWLYT